MRVRKKVRERGSGFKYAGAERTGGIDGKEYS
jgi:hypothetical protein